jgi:hypothetical protein
MSFRIGLLHHTCLAVPLTELDFAHSALIVDLLAAVCGLGKSRPISGIYTEQFELRLSLLMSLKRDEIPRPQTTASAAFLKSGNKRVGDDGEASWETAPTPRAWLDD